MTSGDPLQADTTDAQTDGVAAPSGTKTPQGQAGEAVNKAPVEPETEAAEIAASEEAESVDSAEPSPESTATDLETRDDDAWMEACRTKASDTDEADEPSDPPQDDEAQATDEPETKKVLLDRIENLSDSIHTLESDIESLRTQADDSDNEAALTELSNRLAAIEKTGDDAMSKFGHAIGAVAERDDDLEDRGMEYAAEMASPSRTRDSDVAPYIANAERELEESKSSGPVDIFDRIAQAAESQFDESRGSAAKRVSELVDDRRVGTKRWTPSKTMRQRMEKLEAARAAAAEAPAEAPKDATVVAPAVAASAPTSSTATMVSPGGAAKAAAKSAETTESVIATPAPEPEQERVVISRRDKQADAEEEIETASAGATDAEAEAEEELDADGLRVVPGARGRRRDRARKSRLDEDFEKIFDEDEKPSIGSLRRKLRTASAAQDEDNAETTETKASVDASGETQTDLAETPKTGLFSRLLKPSGKKADVTEDAANAVTEEAFGAEPVAASKPSFLSRFSNGKAAPVDAADEEALVDAFEADGASMSNELEFEGDETVSYDDWEDAPVSGSSSKIKPILAAGGLALLGGAGFYLYKIFLGG